MTRIAVILPLPYRGGTLRAARDIACMLRTARGIPPLEVVFARVAAGAEPVPDDREFQALGICERAITWKTIGRADAERLARTSLPRFELHGRHDRYVVPDDGAADLGDCAFWLVISDRVPAPLLPIRPYGVMVFDCLQRFVPSIHTSAAWYAQLDGLVPFVREAAVVLVTTPVAAADVHTFLGVPRVRIRQAPLCFTPPAVSSAKPPSTEPYFVWATNRSSHKNHAMVLRALRSYYEDYDGRLKTVILGVETEYLRPDRAHHDPTAEAYLQPLRMFLSDTEILRENVTVVGEVSDAAYTAALAGSRFLLHSSLYDNGTFAAFDAAYLGVATLSSRYPAMIYLDRAHGLNVSWFDPYSPDDLARQIARLEREGPSGTLPARDRLEALHWSRHANEFRRTLASCLPASP